jgi:hypothetical protein
MTFSDKIVTAVLLAISVVVLLFQGFFLKGETGERVVITTNGKVYASYNLENEDRVVDIDTEFGSNTVVIKDGCVFVKEASCPDKLDVKMGKISKTNQKIVCLPNRLMIEIMGSDGKVDKVSH